MWIYKFGARRLWPRNRSEPSLLKVLKETLQDEAFGLVAG